MNSVFDLDMLGMVCPDFGFSLRGFIRGSDVPAGAILNIKADAHNANRDINALCTFGDHELLSVEPLSDKAFLFTIKKGAK